MQAVNRLPDRTTESALDQQLGRGLHTLVTVPVVPVVVKGVCGLWLRMPLIKHADTKLNDMMLQLW